MSAAAQSAFDLRCIVSIEFDPAFAWQPAARHDRDMLSEIIDREADASALLDPPKDIR